MNKDFWVGKGVKINVLPDVESDGVRMVLHWSEKTKMIVIMSHPESRKVVSELRAVNYISNVDVDEKEPDYCPFCGPGSDVCVEGYKDEFSIACHSCGSTSGYFKEEETAIKNWNRRY